MNVQIKDKASAAAAFTNSMLCLLELSYPTKEELHFAHETLLCTRSLRQKGSVDAGYHSFQMSLATKKLLEIGDVSPSPDTFRKILRGFDRAQQLFKRHDHNFDRQTYHRNVVEVITDWLIWQQSNTEKDLADSISDLSPLREQFNEISNAQLISLLRTNPVTLGIAKTPVWTPTEAAVINTSIQLIPKFDLRLEAAI